MSLKSKKCKRKKSSRKSKKEELWRLISRYVRLKAADSDGYVECVTCGNKMFWLKDGAQAGHFVPQAQGDAVRFDLRNIHVQCYRCNINLGSNGPEYNAFMLRTYGQKTIDELRRLSNTTIKYTEADFDDMITTINELIDGLPKHSR